MEANKTIFLEGESPTLSALNQLNEIAVITVLQLLLKLINHNISNVG